MALSCAEKSERNVLELFLNLQKSCNQFYCQNKSEVLPNSYPGVYELQCSCQSRYFDETKKNIILSQAIEHQQDGLKGKLESSGATEYTLAYHGNFNWLHPKTMIRERNYKQRKIREALEIEKANENDDENMKLLIEMKEILSAQTHGHFPLQR